MTAATILQELLAAGIEPSLTADGANIWVPGNTLSDAQRAAIRTHKPELLALLRHSTHLTADLLAAAARACDHWNDSQAARYEMRRQCLETPPHLQAELLQHFRTAYPSPDAKTALDSSKPHGTRGDKPEIRQ